MAEITEALELEKRSKDLGWRALTLINSLLQIFNFGAALVAAFWVDRLGRRTLFLWSSIGMLLSYMVWVVCSAINSETGSRPAGIMVIVCVFVVYFHYDIACPRAWPWR
ncbi:hypothetical protein BO78DRAFT_431183 [Aspergillus sclerotiicarbonarius CBS 121057]|uniref:Major facilitator superfamily (MFS) profile domain-containing protein n=1 Tax=Aspergillus sclerotiicarbonarius (strain CBS 121057 / IBT 28362) TaxID=1448318 RepID=A0A319E3Q6_ASPSB|nr:hypothetical protein BO78DRAFT_431183 [Aspergillus sclerotiicarbonarius CBS 121057]